MTKKIDTKEIRNYKILQLKYIWIVIVEVN